MSDEELDDLFRKAADNTQPPFDPEAWAAMNRKLDEVQPPPPKGYKRLLLLLAALLIPTLAILYLTDTPKQQDKTSSIRKEVQALTIPRAGKNPQQYKARPATKPATAIRKEPTTSGNAASGKTIPGAVLSERPKQTRPIHTESINTGHAPYTGAIPVAAALVPDGRQENNVPAIMEMLSTRFPGVEKNITAALAAQHDSVPVPHLTAVIPAAAPDKVAEKDISQERVFGRALQIALVVAPDFTTVKFRNPEAVSANAGISISLPLTRKLSLVSGAIWAHKVYAAAPKDYAPMPDFWKGKVLPNTIDARCQVLDIPLNLQWQLLARGKSALALQAGLSSYLMLREKYTYQYGSSGYGAYYKTREVANQNYHWFGVQNLSVSYSHALSPAFSVGVEPFVKIPLTSIGAGKVSLTSAGVFLSAGYRFALKK